MQSHWKVISMIILNFLFRLINIMILEAKYIHGQYLNAAKNKLLKKK